jgi:hypothetical protein
MDLVPDLFRILEIDRIDLEEREVTFAFLRSTDRTLDGITGLQREAADLRGGDVDVVRTRQIVGIGGTQEAEAVRSTSTTPSPMISISWLASIFRIANISSCLRMTLAFSTPTDSAKASRSVGVLFLSS